MPVFVIWVRDLLFKEYLCTNRCIEVGGCDRFLVRAEGWHYVSASGVGTLEPDQHRNSVHFCEHITFALSSDRECSTLYPQLILKLVEMSISAL